MFSKSVFLLFFVVYLSDAILTEELKNNVQVKSENKVRDCANSYSVTCLKLDVVSLIDKLNEEDHYSVIPGVSVIKQNDTARLNTADLVAELARQFPNDPDARLNAYLFKKFNSYLSSHTVHFDGFSEDFLGTSRAGDGGSSGGSSGGGGGGSKEKGGGGMSTILVAGAMMKGMLLALSAGSIAVVAGKALMAGLISLLISAVIGIKALTHHSKETTYEVVSKPVYSHSSSHSVAHEEHHPTYGHSSYGRSFDVPLPVSLHPEYKPT